MDTAREIQLIETFVVRQKRARYVGFLSSQKLRPKFLRELYYFGDFDSTRIVELSGASNSDDGLIAELKRRSTTSR